MAGKRWLLFMDQLRVHTSKDTKAFMNKEGIHYVYSPVYQCQYNPIELYFSQLKDRVKKARLKAMFMGQRPRYENLIQEAVNGIGIDVVNK